MRFDKFTLASINRSMVLKTIWENDAISKAEIARQTGLSIPTSMKITDELLENGIIRSCGKMGNTAGKRPEMYEFAGDTYYSVGIDISPTKAKAVVMNLNGKVITSCKTSIQDPKDVKGVVHAVSDLIVQVIYESRVPPSVVIGIGVGMPGILDTEQGFVVFSPNFYWENVHLIELIEDDLRKKTDLKLSISIDNSNRALALGEQYFGAAIGNEFFICINLGYGIGAAAIENGELSTGASGTAGEFGHIVVEKDGPLCACGNYGCLEAMASGKAIAQQARNMVASGIDTNILKLAEGNIKNIEAKTVFEAAKTGDLAAANLVRRAAEYIGIGIASYINLLDPEKIVLAGGMSCESDLIEQIQKSVLVRRMRFAGRRVKLQVSNLGEYATAIGAAAIYIKKIIQQGGLLRT